MEDPNAISYLLASVIACSVVASLIYVAKRWDEYKLAFALPGPRAIPPFGNALLFRGNFEDILNAFNYLVASYSSPLRIWLGHRVQFVISDADQIKKIVLSEKFIEKHFTYKFVHAVVGTGLLTAPASKWLVHRKLIAPTFNTVFVQSYVPIFVEHAKRLAKRLETKVNGPEFEILEPTSEYTLHTITSTAFGVEQHTGSETAYQHAVESFMESSFRRILSFWLHPDFIYRRTRHGQESQQNADVCRTHAVDILQRKKERLVREKMKVVTEDDEAIPKRKAFLDLLMNMNNNGAKFSDEELLEEVATIVVAGHDTTLQVACFVLLMMASNPNVQEEVYRELCEIFEDDFERDVTYADTHRMVYMERVIRETMRLFPAGPLIGRQAMADVKIGEHTIPRGASVIIGIFSLHRNPRHWPEPLKFDPDRFLPEEIAKRHPFCYVPFFAGSRNCPGSKYAIVSMKVLLATLLRKYVVIKNHIPAIEDIKVEACVVLRPTKKITVRIENRRPIVQNDRT